MTPFANAATFDDSSAGSRGVLAKNADVTPSRSDEAAGRRITDASKISFPIQIMIAIVTVALTVYGSVWAAMSRQEQANAAMRTDIAVMRQVQADQAKADDLKRQLDEANRQLIMQSVNAVKDDVIAVRGQVNLAVIDIGNVRREMGTRR